PWTTVGEPITLDALGYFTATRTAPQAVPGEWRSALLDPTTGAELPGATSNGTTGT
ncbi:MAG: hypothetical protein H0W96_14160, partial [Solirubrobacterales bacterium]|nr:hypothetical protein [Solirubrobacterales bacterium]